MLVKATSFAAIGAVNAVIDAAVFFLALRYLTSSLILANVMAWSVAVSCSYVMNSLITFAAESGRTLRWRDYARFALSGAAGLTASTVIVVLVARIFPVWFAKLAAIGAGFVVNFSLSHFVVFRSSTGQRAPHAAPTPSSEASRRL